MAAGEIYSCQECSKIVGSFCQTNPCFRRLKTVTDALSAMAYDAFMPCNLEELTFLIGLIGKYVDRKLLISRDG